MLSGCLWFQGRVKHRRLVPGSPPDHSLFFWHRVLVRMRTINSQHALLISLSSQRLFISLPSCTQHAHFWLMTVDGSSRPEREHSKLYSLLEVRIHPLCLLLKFLFFYSAKRRAYFLTITARTAYRPSSCGCKLKQTVCRKIVKFEQILLIVP